MDTAKEAFSVAKTALSALEFYASHLEDPITLTAKSRELAIMLRQKSVDFQGDRGERLLLALANAFEDL
ncbi:hypothetical protein [Noviherbaspirillum aerium]|uniref:hypothetical protein n=1 Tax=Noviherbaspirillum aerium TaxID=2588497 RepID=UPI00124EBBCA|nr:hypothetical protein [Noviherbaspirillum aerium]